MLAPLNLLEVPFELENTIYLFLMQLVEDDMNKKAVVGRLIFEFVFKERLRLITSDGDVNRAFLLYSAESGLSHQH